MSTTSDNPTETGGFLVRYAYPGFAGTRTEDERTIGDVYVLKCDWGSDVYSYTKDPAEATAWSTRELAELAAHVWNRHGAVVVLRRQADTLT